MKNIIFGKRPKMDQPKSPKSKSNILSIKVPGIYLLLFIGLLLLLTLPFHYIIPNGSNPWHMFPKENLSFNHTFTTAQELSDISEKYHDASPVDQLEMSNDPFIRKLVEEDALYTIKDVTHKDGSTFRVIMEK
jgi:hypothetical protein